MRRKRAAQVLLLVVTASIATCAWRLAERPSVSELLVEALTNPEARGDAYAAVLGAIKEGGAPVVEDGRAIFAYLSDEPVTVCVAGDWNGWSPYEDCMARLWDTPLYFTIIELPEDARVEYLLIVDDRPMPDPLNPRRSVGPESNSEVKMPGYEDPERFRGCPPGEIRNLTVWSTSLGYSLEVWVYLPPVRRGPYPTLYVLDGGGYMRYAEMAEVLDCLIYEGEIPPLIAVFVQPAFRDCEYSANPAFLRFLAEELVPLIEESFPTRDDPHSRGILGASLGGLAALHAALSRPDLFGRVAAQSGAFVGPSVLRAVCPAVEHADVLALAESAPPSLRVVLQWGEFDLIHWIDLREANEEMYATLVDRGFDAEALVVPEGHNWGCWRGHLAELLRILWG